jgi:hypothetical protein
MDKSQLDLFIKPSGRTAIPTASGFVIDLIDPDASGLPVEDVARALAYQPRWCGATKHFYSVAEHSVMVSRLVPEPLSYHALWHDCIELSRGIGRRRSRCISGAMPSTGSWSRSKPRWPVASGLRAALMK